MYSNSWFVKHIKLWYTGIICALLGFILHFLPFGMWTSRLVLRGIRNWIPCTVPRDHQSRYASFSIRKLILADLSILTCDMNPIMVIRSSLQSGNCDWNTGYHITYKKPTLYIRKLSAAWSRMTRWQYPCHMHHIPPLQFWLLCRLQMIAEKWQRTCYLIIWPSNVFYRDVQ